MLNFKMSELIHSDVAVKNNINNMPDINALDCMLELVNKIYKEIYYNIIY